MSARGMEDEDEISPPLFVRIQTIDLQSLDFQTNIGSSAKYRHLTYVEATNLFLFLGSTSGSVYVFSRDTLKFLFIIPFKGGKVCSIACSQDESDIAVGSIRGKVTIYRISPNVHYMQSSASAPLIDAFRDIYDVPHHVGTEITEMQWSPNGKYLFVGDSQGLVSQMDIACLEEFPRPVPSKIILKLQSRVLQIDCSFPYLAVCTLAAVFLCDLEKEDFTRVQCTKGKDIKSTGLSLMILPERSSLRDLGRERTIPSAKLILFIGEVGYGAIHCCNMEGNVQSSRKVQVSTKVSKYPMSLFDPTKPAPTIPCEGDSSDAGALATNSDDDEGEEVRISLGKMLCTDDGMIVSVCNDRLYVFDPYTLNVIAWNEEFKRINNFKIISNYAFIWTGNKLEVVAFTAFRLYAEQLFRAKLTDVLESWIVYTVYSLGWRLPFRRAESESASLTSLSECLTEETLPESTSSSLQMSSTSKSEQVILNFKKIMFSESMEESEFVKFVLARLPFPLDFGSRSEVELVVDSSDSSDSQPGRIADVVEEESAVIDRHIGSFLSGVASTMKVLLSPPLTIDKSHIPPSYSSSSSSLSESNFQQQPNTTLPSDNNSKILWILSNMLKKSRADSSDICVHVFNQLWGSLVDFYEDVGCSLPQLDYKKSDLTLTHTLNAAQSFFSQPRLVNLSREISQSDEVSKFEEVAVQMICCLYCQQSKFKKSFATETFPKTELLTPATATGSSQFTLCFTKLVQCPLVIQWFREMGTSSESLLYDALIADTLLLLLPLLPHESDDGDPPSSALLSSCLDAIGMYEKLPKYFMTWLFLCKFLHQPKQVPYSPLLRSLLNEQLFEKMAEEMFSTIYRDFKLSSFGNAVHFIHHFVSSIVLLSKSPSCEQTRSVSILLCCFPLTKWAREDIVTKIIAACHLNPSLLGLYLKACLEDGHSMKLCSCGIQAGYGSLDGKISSWQRAIEEAIIKLLLEEYFKSSPYDDADLEDVPADGNGNNTQKRRAEVLVHMFAMRRGLLETYFRSPLPDEFLSDEMQAELIVRSGSCVSLKYFQCSEKNMTFLLRSYQNHFHRDKINYENPHGKQMVENGVRGFNKCNVCSTTLQHFHPNFKPFSRDCLGLWALKQVGSLEKLIEIVQGCGLNLAGVFSARFYGAAGQINDKSLRRRFRNNTDMSFSGESHHSSCYIFH